MSGLSELIAKLEGLSGPDRELDHALFQHFYAGMIERGQYRRMLDVYVSATDPLDRMSIDAFTASLDAAVALVERKLPGQEWTVGSRDTLGHPWGKVRSESLRSIQDSAATPAIALCLALLRSLEGRDE